MVGNARQVVNWIMGQEPNIQIKAEIYKPKRGLRANAYYWEMLTQLADTLRISKEELHFQMLQRYSQVEMISVLADIDIGNYTKYYLEAGESNLNRQTIQTL